MLQYRTVEPRTLDVLKELMNTPGLDNFYLVGGTALEDSIRIMRLRDIMAMKIAAILKRGVKKDFWDISELLHHYSIADIIDCYNQKYPNHQMLISIPQAMIYFDDAENSEDPLSKKGQTWSIVKKHIRQKVNEYLQ